MKYKVIGWTNAENEAYEYDDADITRAMELAVIDELIKNDYRFTAEYHQHGKSGCPVLNNGKRLVFSMRHWGAIVAEARKEDNSNGFAYMLWYMTPFTHADDDEPLTTKEPTPGVDETQICKDAGFIEICDEHMNDYVAITPELREKLIPARKPKPPFEMKLPDKALAAIKRGEKTVVIKRYSRSLKKLEPEDIIHFLPTKSDNPEARRLAAKITTVYYAKNIKDILETDIFDLCGFAPLSQKEAILQSENNFPNVSDTEFGFVGFEFSVIE